MIAIRRGWFHLAGGAGVGRICGFISNLFLSRWLGPSNLGLFNLVLTTIQTCDTLVRCGGDYAINFILGAKPDSLNTRYGDKTVKGFVQLCSLTTVISCVVVGAWVWWGRGIFPSDLVGTHRLLLTSFLLLMIACEGISASAWEVLLVTHRTISYALKQGLFVPLRIILAAVGGLFAGVLGAMLGWTLSSVIQCFWLKSELGHLWSPFHIWPFLYRSCRQLLRRGLPFYAANLFSSIIFYPLFLQLSSASGFTEIGYLRVGQILQQLFAFLPATLAPVLFLRLRGESTFAEQVSLIERPLRAIWLLLLEVLLVYCMVDHFLILWLFGPGFVSALLPTRLLLATALFESLSQLIVQPVLASGKTRFYGLSQNGSAVISAILGWLWIPKVGLAAYLIVRLMYVIIPLISFGVPIVRHLQEPYKFLPLILASILMSVFFVGQLFNIYEGLSLPFLLIISIVILVLQRHDISSLSQFRGKV